MAAQMEDADRNKSMQLLESVTARADKTPNIPIRAASPEL